jgi:predicted transposase YdaD
LELMSLIGLLWKQRLMDETSEWTINAINHLIELGMTLERIADRLGIDIEDVIVVECPVV